MPGLPPILVATNKEWHSPGVGEKPSECQTCPFSLRSKGFVGDFVGSNPKVALLLSFPHNADILERMPLKGDWWNYILREFLYPSGFKKENLLVSYVLRCKPPWNPKRRQPGYPTGRTRDMAEIGCRVYDDRHMVDGELEPQGLLNFDPNIVLVTFDLKDVLGVPAYKRQIQRDLQKAKMLVEKGYRPLVTFGSEATELHLPWVRGKGGAKAFRGHFTEQEYKFKNI